jgi:hypothetical protein
MFKCVQCREYSVPIAGKCDGCGGLLCEKHGNIKCDKGDHLMCATCSREDCGHNRCFKCAPVCIHEGCLTPVPCERCFGCMICVICSEGPKCFDHMFPYTCVKCKHKGGVCCNKKEQAESRKTMIHCKDCEEIAVCAKCTLKTKGRNYKCQDCKDHE